MVWLLEGFLAAELGIIWKEHHGDPFEIRQFTHIIQLWLPGKKIGAEIGN